jgi:hypothetical protein
VNQKRKGMTLADQADEANWEGRFAAIEKEAAQILATEGTHYVRGVYFVLESDAQMARMIEAERRVAHRENRVTPLTSKQEMDLVAIKSAGQAKLQSLFDASPNCNVCGVAIESIDRATVFTPEGGKDTLIHDGGTCFGAAIEASIGRYMGRGRGRILEMRVES